MVWLEECSEIFQNGTIHFTDHIYTNFASVLSSVVLIMIFIYDLSAASITCKIELTDFHKTQLTMSYSKCSPKASETRTPDTDDYWNSRQWKSYIRRNVQCSTKPRSIETVNNSLFLSVSIIKMSSYLVMVIYIWNYHLSVFRLIPHIRNVSKSLSKTHIHSQSQGKLLLLRLRCSPNRFERMDKVK